MTLWYKGSKHKKKKTTALKKDLKNKNKGLHSKNKPGLANDSKMNKATINAPVLPLPIKDEPVP